jgi:predicted transcriptional regulator
MGELPLSNISVNIKDQKIKQVDRLAEHLDRTRSWIINDALDQYVAKQEGLLASIRQSVQEADARRLLKEQLGK